MIQHEDRNVTKAVAGVMKLTDVGMIAEHDDPGFSSTRSKHRSM
jgi:hypothetical protein